MKVPFGIIVKISKRSNLSENYLNLETKLISLFQVKDTFHSSKNKCVNVHNPNNKSSTKDIKSQFI